MDNIDILIIELENESKLYDKIRKIYDSSETVTQKRLRLIIILRNWLRFNRVNGEDFKRIHDYFDRKHIEISDYEAQGD
jgi:hypothetical protein